MVTEALSWDSDGADGVGYVLISSFCKFWCISTHEVGGVGSDPLLQALDQHSFLLCRKTHRQIRNNMNANNIEVMAPIVTLIPTSDVLVPPEK
jgi:hypothetical protein